MFATLSKSAAVAALACAGAMLVPTVSQAQAYSYQGYARSYDYYGQNHNARDYQQPYYDPCVRDQRERQTAGGLVGAAIGAVAGSQVAARGRRTEGSVLGGVLGAMVGSGVGRSQAACESGYSQQVYAPAPVYGDRGYDYDDRGYDYDRRDYGYDRRYDDRYGDYDRDYARPVERYDNTDSCRLAESRIRLPDGREEVRYVRACPDAQGRYRIVD